MIQREGSQTSDKEHMIPAEFEDLRMFLEGKEYTLQKIERSGGEPITVISFRHNQDLPGNLPEGFAFMGGAARNVVFKEIGEPVLPPRDIDLVAITDLKPDLTLSDGLSKTYMSEDYKYGHGVSKESFRSFFTSRDFTLNEVLVCGDRVFATPEALRDYRDKIICPTEYERNRWKNPLTNEEGVTSKIVLKALRFQVEFEELYGEGEIAEIADWQWTFNKVPLFWIALNLQKAYERGDALATRFYTKLLTVGVIDPVEQGGRKEEVALNVHYGMKQEGKNPFRFTQDTLNQIVADQDEKEEDDAFYDYYAGLANTYLRKHKKRVGEEPVY